MNYTETLQNWRSVPVNTVAELDAKLESFRILFAYNSNKIENKRTSYHIACEIFENGKVINYTGDLRTLYEIQNQKSCYEFLREKIVKRVPVTIDLIKSVHQELMHGCYDERRWELGERPGEFKKRDYEVGDGIGVSPESVEFELNGLLEELKSVPKDKVLTAAAYFHLRFESIHPFADGNGRVGRTLLNYYLMINDYPPAIIYDEDKQAYYMALTVFDKTEQISGFEAFLKEETCKTWAKKSPSGLKLAMFL